MSLLQDGMCQGLREDASGFVDIADVIECRGEGGFAEGTLEFIASGEGALGSDDHVAVEFAIDLFGGPCDGVLVLDPFEI